MRRSLIFVRPPALRRAPDVVACERKQCDAADEIWQFRLDPPQQGIICAHISRFARYGMAEPAQKMLKIADVIVNLCGKYLRIIERALLRRRLGVLPLTPEDRPPSEPERAQRRPAPKPTVFLECCAATLALVNRKYVVRRSCNRRPNIHSRTIFLPGSISGLKLKFLSIRLIVL